ncbi:MAG: tyrosine-type recombinase/integrase [Candidatus Hodarchaeota archaeon]
MPIYLRCPFCKTDLPPKFKKCRNCGQLLPQRDKVYRVLVKYAGQKVTKHVPNSLELAKEIEAKIKTELIDGSYFDRRRKVPVLDEVWERYLSEARELKKSWDRDLNRYSTHLQPRFGKKALDAVTPMDVQRMILELKKNEKAPKSIRNTAELLKRLYNYARRLDLYDGANPLDRVKLPKVSNGVVEYLEPDQLKRLWEVCQSYPDIQARNFVRLALLTGCRRGELFRLRWDNVSLERGWMTLEDPKGGRDQVVPLNKMAILLLKSHPRVEGSLYVFPGKNGKQRVDFKRPWTHIRRLAELPQNFRFHGLRHTFASYLASSGQVPIHMVQRLLTHATPAMTQRYSHLAEDALRRGAETMDRILADILGDKGITTSGRD